MLQKNRYENIKLHRICLFKYKYQPFYNVIQMSSKPEEQNSPLVIEYAASKSKSNN